MRHFRRLLRWLRSRPLDIRSAPDRCELYPRVFVPMGQRREQRMVEEQPDYRERGR